jgi:hypothetical protein
MKARELAEILMQHPDADMMVTIKTRLFTEDPEAFDGDAVYEVVGVDEGWLPSGVLSIEMGEELISD